MKYYCIAVVMAITFAAPVCAHHSNAFYTEELIEVSGELVDVKWRNPHSWFTVRLAGGDDEESLWRIEGNSTFNYQRGGVNQGLFQVGDQVKVKGYLSSLDSRALEGASMLLPGGREVLLWEDQEAHFPEEGIVITGAEETVVDAAGENKGIFRVWSSPRGIYWGQQMAKQPFRETALANRGSYDMLDNFATRCEGEGMPRIMVNPHSFEFTDHGNEISLVTELYDTERIIHMDRSAVPADAPASKLGYSVGTWEGGTLVVTTARVNWPYFDNRGSGQSEDVGIVEHFTLSEDQTRLDFEITVTDPEFLTRPAVLTGYWLALGHVLPPYNCQRD